VAARQPAAGVKPHPRLPAGSGQAAGKSLSDDVFVAYQAVTLYNTAATCCSIIGTFCAGAAPSLRVCSPGLSAGSERYAVHEHIGSRTMQCCRLQHPFQ
jgi:hypothetical protein